jgi:glycerol-3-phosphate dehydrogenase (NAD(P)+)
MNITILGAGAWGTALATSLAPRHRATLWARDAAQIAQMQASRVNERYLPGISLPPSLGLTADLDSALTDAELILAAVPIAALRSTLTQVAGFPRPVVWACKGMEIDSAKLPHEIAAEVLPQAVTRGVLSGPSFAQEVAQGLPTALTLASSDGAFAQAAAKNLHHARLRIYSSTDIVGVETGGAVKNVLAIAAGISDGLKFGHNARAALITRGLAEMTRLGLKLGGRMETLTGLSGMGDLILTCTGNLSRNRQVGLHLAQQESLPDILQRLGHVAEGVYTARAVHRLAKNLQVQMPICDAVYRILYENVPASQAVELLLSREPNAEF